MELFRRHRALSPPLPMCGAHLHIHTGSHFHFHPISPISRLLFFLCSPCLTRQVMRLPNEFIIIITGVWLNWARAIYDYDTWREHCLFVCSTYSFTVFRGAIFTVSPSRLRPHMAGNVRVGCCSFKNMAAAMSAWWWLDLLAKMLELLWKSLRHLNNKWMKTMHFA